MRFTIPSNCLRCMMKCTAVASELDRILDDKGVLQRWAQIAASPRGQNPMRAVRLQDLHYRPEQPAHDGGETHGQCSPEGHARRSPEHCRSAGPCREGTERGEKHERRTCDHGDHVWRRGYERGDQRQRRTHCERGGRRKAGLHGARAQDVGHAELVSRMRTQSIVAASRARWAAVPTAGGAAL